MSPEAASPAEPGVAEDSLRVAISKRYADSGGERYGITAGRFHQIVAEAALRYAGESERTELVATLHVADLVLARACADGNEAAWEAFLTRFRVPLYDAAYRIAKNDTSGRELADELYAELYGISSRDEERCSKLDHYMGRGSLEGWLRAVLSRRYIDRYRARSREVSLDEQLEAGVGFAAQPCGGQPAAGSCYRPGGRAVAGGAGRRGPLSAGVVVSGPAHPGGYRAPAARARIDHQPQTGSPDRHIAQAASAKGSAGNGAELARVRRADAGVGRAGPECRRGCNSKARIANRIVP